MTARINLTEAQLDNLKTRRHAIQSRVSKLWLDEWTDDWSHDLPIEPAMAEGLLDIASRIGDADLYGKLRSASLEGQER